MPRVRQGDASPEPGRARGSTVAAPAGRAATALRALLLAAVATAALAAPAQAGSYDVYTCSKPDGGPAGHEGWAWSQTNLATGWSSSRCAQGGPLWLGLDRRQAHPSGEVVTGEFKAAPDTTISRYRVHRTVGLQPNSPYYYSQREVRSGALALYDRCWGEESCAGRGDPRQPFAAVNVLEHLDPAPGITGVRFSVGCVNDAQETCPAVAGPGAELQIFRAQFDISDAHFPVLSTPPSGFDPAKPLAGTQPVTIAAEDRGGGVYQALFEVDGQIVQRTTINDNGGACVEPFTRPAPCPPAVGATVGFDTANVRDGRHQLRILVSDAGGNTAPWGPVPITTHNASCHPTPAVSGLRLRARFVRRGHRSRLTAEYRRRVAVSGRLTRSDGTPVRGAAICVATQLQGGGRRRVASGPVTDARGRFRLRIARGPSRTVWIVHRTAAGAAAKRLRLNIRPRVGFRVSTRSLYNNQKLRFRGRVPGPVPRRGALVQIQVDRGDRWQAFASARAKRGGRFTAGYQFTRTLGVASYRLRAYVPAQAAYPYAAGSSRPIIVRVSG